MAKIYNRAGVVSATAGTGTITLGAALGAVAINTCSFRLFADAGVTDGQTVRYLILDNNGAWEYGTGVYTAAGTTLTRVLGASSTGALLSLTGNQQVFITGIAEDFYTIEAPAEFQVQTANAERLRIYSNGKVNINGSTGDLFGAFTPLVVHSFNTNTFDLVRWDTAGGGVAINIGKSRGATIGSFTVSQNNDALGHLRFWGSDGTDFAEGARIEAAVDGTPGNDDMPARLSFQTTPDGASLPIERMQINSAGKVIIVSSLFSAGGFNATFSDSAFDTVFGWDDSAATYKSLLLADILTEGAPAAGARPIPTSSAWLKLFRHHRPKMTAYARSRFPCRLRWASFMQVPVGARRDHGRSEGRDTTIWSTSAVTAHINNTAMRSMESPRYKLGRRLGMSVSHQPPPVPVTADRSGLWHAPSLNPSSTVRFTK